MRIVDPGHRRTVARPARPGEIQMKGPTVTPGYYKRPEANAAAFTDDGWFRSGDLGTITPDGDLVYIARLKEIIRVGGENVAPAEVEQALREETGLKLISVVGVPDERLDEVAAAVVVGVRPGRLAAVLREMRTRLAGFKMPKSIYTADELPMTATNRVQRATLRQWIGQSRLTRVV